MPKSPALPPNWQEWPEPEKARLLATLKVFEWRKTARPDQLPPAGTWRTWYLSGGRGSGKTHSAAHVLAEWVLSDPEPGEWGIVAPTIADARGTCVEGPSGILAALGTNKTEVKEGTSALVRSWREDFGELRLRNGHLIRAASAEDGALRVQGKNLKGLWADEIGLWDRWETAWDESIGFAVRIGRAQIIATGTPKATRKARVLIKRLIDDPKVPVSRLRTVDNAANLSQAFFDSVVSRAKGTRLERQELEGELLTDVEGALWTIALIDAGRITHEQVPDLSRVVVAIDPATTAEEGSDETGIIVVGEAGREGYVLADYSRRAKPEECMRRLAEAYHEHHADCVVVETNNGGDYIPALLRTVDPNIPIRKVSASRGKHVRAQPASSLYEQHRVHHVGSFPELEEQLITWVPGSGESPDRLDALVWGLTDLKGLTGGSWADAYGQTACGMCGRSFVASLHPRNCPHCGAPRQ
ncbi:terminase large subunit domain-containing protein [Streptomyces sp. NPDC093261]|uniref:phage terminase large subunit family protein n=1 Tax=Streptomyces sp. NPDC093261 TaxID=3366037 RepID=UPI0037F81C51